MILERPIVLIQGNGLESVTLRFFHLAASDEHSTTFLHGHSDCDVGDAFIRTGAVLLRVVW